jgi:hypothetical protein
MLMVKQLVELILLEVANLAVESRGVGRTGKDSSCTNLQPIVALQECGRINRCAREVIKSPCLQLAMLGQRGFMTEDIRTCRLVSNHALSQEEFEFQLNNAPILRLVPLEWLLFKGLRLQRCLIQPFRWDLDMRKTARPSLKSRFRDFLLSRRGAAQASWRRVRVFQSDVEGERLSQVRVTFRRPAGYRGSNCYTERMQFEDGVTLGVVFEAVHRVLLRTPVEHAAVIARASVA